MSEERRNRYNRIKDKLMTLMKKAHEVNKDLQKYHETDGIDEFVSVIAFNQMRESNSKGGGPNTATNRIDKHPTITIVGPDRKRTNKIMQFADAITMDENDPVNVEFLEDRKEIFDSYHIKEMYNHHPNPTNDIISSDNENDNQQEDDGSRHLITTEPIKHFEHYKQKRKKRKGITEDQPSVTGMLGDMLHQIQHHQQTT